MSFQSSSAISEDKEKKILAELQLERLLCLSENPKLQIEAYYLSGETLTGLCLAEEINDSYLTSLGHWLAFGKSESLRIYLNTTTLSSDSVSIEKIRDLVFYSFLKGILKNPFSFSQYKRKLTSLPTSSNEDQVLNEIALKLLSNDPCIETLQICLKDISKLSAKHQLIVSACLLRLAHYLSADESIIADLSYKYQQLSMTASFGKTNDVFYVLQSIRCAESEISFSLFQRGRVMMSFTHKILSTLGPQRCARLLFYKRKQQFLSPAEKNKLFLLLSDLCCSLRGPLMKVGQILGTFNVGQATELRDLFTVLNQNKRSIPFYQVKQQIEAALKVPLFSLFRRFENEPTGIGSLSQVHKAELKNGKVVAVKVLYPHAKEIIKSDFRFLRMCYPLFKLFAPHLPLRKYFNELEASLLSECNLMKEGQSLLYFKNAFVEDTEIQFPAPFLDWSNENVLIYEFMEGLSLDEFSKKASQEARNKSATSIIKYTLASAKLACFNSDFNPGNFLFKEDGGLICLDFGSIIYWDKDTQRRWQNSILSSLSKNLDLFQTTLDQVSSESKKKKDAQEIFSAVTGNGLSPWWNFQCQDIKQEEFKTNIVSFIKMMMKPLDGVRVAPNYLWGFRLYYGHVALNSMLMAKLNWGKVLSELSGLSIDTLE